MYGGGRLASLPLELGRRCSKSEEGGLLRGRLAGLGLSLWGNSVGGCRQARPSGGVTGVSGEAPGCDQRSVLRRQAWQKVGGVVARGRQIEGGGRGVEGRGWCQCEGEMALVT